MGLASHIQRKGGGQSCSLALPRLFMRAAARPSRLASVSLSITRVVEKQFLAAGASGA